MHFNFCKNVVRSIFSNADSFYGCILTAGLFLELAICADISPELESCNQFQQAGREELTIMGNAWKRSRDKNIRILLVGKWSFQGGRG